MEGAAEWRASAQRFRKLAETADDPWVRELLRQCAHDADAEAQKIEQRKQAMAELDC